MTKRSFDLVFSILGFALLFPFSLIIVFLIIVESQGPALFKQDRIGIKGKIFNNSFLRQLSPKIEITAYNNNEIISVFKAFGENQVIGSKSLNNFRSEIFDYDNISNLNIKEFRAIMTNERLILEAR